MVQLKKLKVVKKRVKKDKREVPKSEAESFSRKQGIKYIETSAIANEGVTNAFNNLLNDNNYFLFL